MHTVAALPTYKTATNPLSETERSEFLNTMEYYLCTNNIID